jgi:hypothetical protein
MWPFLCFSFFLKYSIPPCFLFFLFMCVFLLKYATLFSILPFSVFVLSKIYHPVFYFALFFFFSFLNIPPCFLFRPFLCFFSFLNIPPCFLFCLFLSFFLLLLNIPPAQAKECKVVAKLLCKDICCL